MPLCKVLAYIVQTCCWWLCSTVQKLALDSVVHDIRHLGRLPCFSAHEGDLQADHPRASGEEAWYGDKASERRWSSCDEASRYDRLVPADAYAGN
jgi:hypothetical protein